MQVLFGISQVSYQFEATLKHPDTGSRYECGIVTATDEERPRDVLLALFRAVWEKRGFYHHTMELTITTYYDFVDEIMRADWTMSGGWYDNDEDLLETVTRKLTKTPKEGV